MWNPSSKDLLNVEDDEAGRLAGFRARFGRVFDVGREPTASTETADDVAANNLKAVEEEKVEDAGLEDNGFAEEEDANLLDLISSFGQEGDGKRQKESGGIRQKKGSGKGK